jgi:methylglyoxal/glyoxal reductase
MNWLPRLISTFQISKSMPLQIVYDMPKINLKPKRPEFPASWFQPAMPGFGTFPWPHVKAEQDYETVARTMQRTIEDALSIGYRHLDTAFTYRNQDLVGAAIRAVGVPRKDIFVTSKLHQNNNNYHDAISKISEALHLIWGQMFAAGDRYLDAFLLHYPGKGHPADAWKALQEARDNGLVRHIGVSNFEIWHIEILKKKSGEYPELNQIEFHPWIYKDQKELLEYCQEHDIAVEGYSPLAQGIALQNPMLQNFAKEYQTTPARILLKWCLQHRVKPIVGSRNSEHLRSNAECYKFNLSDCQMEELDRLGASTPLHIAKQWQWDPKTAAFGDTSCLRSLRKIFF